MKLSEGSTITFSVLITLLLGVVYSVWVVASLSTTVQAHDRKVEKVDQMAEDMGIIKSDIRWIRDRLEKK